ncbi:MAG: DUF1439 domain-containing protein [Lysobacter sp.]|nr:DUF1439 domain-containing protein [Lysobacter sp.]MDQ3269357.1 DUF1439 domain-containing protein [Pseudomonadota bacterium]
MSRRVAAVVLMLLAVLAAGCSTLSAVGALLGSQVTFTQPQLQQSLNRNFPKEYERLGGLVKLKLMNPQLSIPHGQTRLRLAFDVGFGGPGSSAIQPGGSFALTSGLRFDPGTRGLHLQNPSIEQVDVPALGGALNTSSRDVLNSWLQDYSREEPVYRLDSSLLDRISGRRISSTQIERGVVVVNLGN